MDPVLFVFGGAAALLWMAATREERRLRRHWRAAIESCALADVIETAGLFGLAKRISGRAGRLTLYIAHYSQNRRRGTRIAIEGGDRPLCGLALRRETTGTAIAKRMGAREIETGDRVFDDAFYVGGTSPEALGLLDAETRRDLLALNLRGQVRVTDEDTLGLQRAGELQIDLSDDVWELPFVLSDALAKALTCARRLTSDRTTLDRLLANVRDDPEPAVRVANLGVLVREFLGEPEVEDAVRRAGQDASPRVRLCASLALGAEGREGLVQLAESDADEECAARAIEALRAHWPVERAIVRLKEALAGRRLGIAGACVKVLGAAGPTQAGAAEPVLMDAVSHDDVDLRMAAARALGRVGAITAVLPLQEAAARIGTPGLITAARQAVAEIQSRIAGASPGQLSMAGAEMGQLAVADAEGGEISVADGAAGRLSSPSTEPSEDES